VQALLGCFVLFSPRVRGSTVAQHDKVISVFINFKSMALRRQKQVYSGMTAGLKGLLHPA